MSAITAATSASAAQLQHATLTAVVLDASRTPVSGADVALTDPLGAVVQREVTDALGRAVFPMLAPGRYELRTVTIGSPAIQLPVSVTAALPIEITVRVPAAVSDRVVVEGLAQHTTARGSVAGASIARVPSRVRSRALQEVIATLPGWSTEDNGLLHARGVDDGFLYVVDGVPVYERLDALSGLTPEVSALGSINVITGYVPPEYGYKAGGVIEVRSALATTWHATAEGGAGSDRTREASAAIGGPLGTRVGARVGGAMTRSDRYLDPVHPDNLHNRGAQGNAFGQLEWAPSAMDRVSGGWGAGRAHFDVPHGRAQEDAGQDQRQRVGQVFLTGNWQRSWSTEAVTQAALYHRRTSAALEGSAFDTPLAAHADRTLTRTGLLAAVTRQHQAHLVKAGVEVQRLSLHERFSFSIIDQDDAEEAGFRQEALAFTVNRPFVFSDRADPMLFSTYVQDTWQARPYLTLSGGVRFDRSQLLLTRTQWSPRFGTALRLAEQTVLRGAVSRYFQPPQPENLLLASSPEARVLSSIVVHGAEGGAALEPERQWGTEIGLEHRWRHARVDVAYWRRWMRNVADPNVFAATTIIFPNAVAKGRAHGLEMRLEVPRSRGWSGYLNAALGSVVQTGPIEGGLFLDDEVEEIGPGVEFTPDHDQRVTAGGGLSWEHARSRIVVSMTVRHETGTPVPFDDDDHDPVSELPGSALVNLEAGRVKARTVVSLLATAPVFGTTSMTGTLAVQAANLFDAHYAYNFGNPFSGTHFGAPRTIAVSVRVAFR